jgi:chromosome segregation ATPase
LQKKIEELSETQLAKERDDAVKKRDAAEKELNDTKLLKVKQIVNDLATVKRELEQANDEIKNQRQMAANQMTQNEGLKQKLTNKDTELASINETLKGMKKEQKDANDLMEKIGRQELEIDTQNAQIKALQAGSGDVETLKQIQDLKKQFDDKLNHDQDEIKALKATIEEQVKTIEDNAIKIVGLEEDTRKKELEYNQMKKEDEEKIDTQAKTTTQLNADMLTKAGEFNAIIKQRETTIQDHEATIQKQEATIQQHEATIQQQEATIQQHEATIIADKKAISDQQETIKAREAAISKEKDEAKKQHESLQALIETHKKQETSDKKTITDQTSSIKTGNAQLANCQNQLKYYTDQYQTTHKELTAMTKLRDDLKVLVDAKTTDAAFTALKGQFDDVTHEKNELDKRIFDLDMQIVDLHNQIDDLKKQLSSKLLKKLREHVHFPV